MDPNEHVTKRHVRAAIAQARVNAYEISLQSDSQYVSNWLKGYRAAIEDLERTLLKPDGFTVTIFAAVRFTPGQDPRHS